MRSAWLALAVTAGCSGGLTGGQAIDAAASDSAPGDSGGGGKACDPVPSTPFSAPTRVALSSAQFDGKPSLTADGLEIYFKTARPDNVTMHIYRASRTSIGAAWGTPTIVSQVDSGQYDTSPTVSADGLTLWFVSYRSGGPGAGDIYVSTRPSRTAAWTAPLPVDELDTTFYEDGLTVDPTGKIAYLHSTRGGGTNQIYRTTRASPTSPWATPVLVSELASPYDDTNAWISPDECTIYFDSNRPGGLGQFDVFVATRPVPGARFDRVVPVTELNGTFYDADPFLSADQRYVIFTSNRPANEFDIYEATR